MLAAGLMLAAAVAIGQDAKTSPTTTVIQDVVAGESHVNGEASWDSVFFEHLSSTCWLTGDARQRELGKHAGVERRADYLDCEAKAAWVYNKGDKPLLCEGEIRLHAPDESGLTVIRSKRIAFPGLMVPVVTAFTYDANHPKSHATRCVVASQKDLVDLPRADCRLQMVAVADPDYFYPPEAKAQGKTAVVTIDSAVDAKSQRLRDVFVSESYADRDFNIAALQVAMNSRMAPEDCGGKRFRFRVKFSIRQPEKPTPPGAVSPSSPAPSP